MLNPARPVKVRISSTLTSYPRAVKDLGITMFATIEPTLVRFVNLVTRLTRKIER